MVFSSINEDYYSDFWDYFWDNNLKMVNYENCPQSFILWNVNFLKRVLDLLRDFRSHN